MSSSNNASPKSANSTKSLGERLANIAEKHKKKNTRTALREMLNKARESGAIRSTQMIVNTPHFHTSQQQCETTPKPPSMIKNNRGVLVPNPAYANWKKKCQAGGKRKTRRSKKSRRSTRRRR
jgi:hypothetical protein